MPKLKQISLPDGTPFWCLRPEEIPLLCDSVQEYFRHGVTVADGDVVFDVGANIGLFGHQVRRLGRRDVSIYSFEPIPAIYEALRANAHASGSDQWIALPYGLGRQSGPVTFAYNFRASMLSSAYPDDSPEQRMCWRETVARNLDRFPWFVRWLGWLPGFLRNPLLDLGVRKVLKTRKVACVLRTFSEVVRAHGLERIDLLKIDVERSEMDVLAGIDAEDWPKIRQVVLEVHDLDNGCVGAAKALLERHGFANVIIEQEPMLKGTDIYNLYAHRRPAAAQALRPAG
jgi:FkbM family methyltransferase